MAANQSPMLNAMSVDVEDYFHVAALSESIRVEDWDTMPYRGEDSTARLIDLFAEFGIRSTFFVLGWMARRSPDLIRRIHAEGHEVACHGMSHQLIYRQTPEVFARETRESKALLEDLIGDRVTGYRAASWSITRDSLWALDIIRDQGFEYDSSIFPIWHDRYGIPDAPTAPGTVRTPSGAQIVEFPPTTARVLGRRLPVAGGGYFRLLPYWLTRYGLRQVNREQQQPFVFYLHPWEVDPQQPRVPARLVSRFRHYNNLSRTEPRLRRLLSEFRCGTVRQVLEQQGLLQPRTA